MAAQTHTHMHTHTHNLTHLDITISSAGKTRRAFLVHPYTQDHSMTRLMTLKRFRARFPRHIKYAHAAVLGAHKRVLVHHHIEHRRVIGLEDRDTRLLKTLSPSHVEPCALETVRAPVQRLTRFL